MDYNMDKDTISGVSCGVTYCKYHTNDDHCKAQGISVQNENAHKKAETFCSTFSDGARG